MIGRQRLIKKLENMAMLEDEGILLITRTLNRIVEKSDLPEDKKARIWDIISRIEEESKGHKEAILQMIERIKESSKDEF